MLEHLSLSTELPIKNHLLTGGGPSLTGLDCGEIECGKGGTGLFIIITPALCCLSLFLNIILLKFYQCVP